MAAKVNYKQVRAAILKRAKKAGPTAAEWAECVKWLAVQVKTYREHYAEDDTPTDAEKHAAKLLKRWKANS